MSAMPMTVPTTNNHRLIIRHEQARSETDKLAETLAGAIGKARATLALVDQIPGACAQATETEERTIRGHIEGRRILGERSRQDIRVYLLALGSWQARHDACGTIAEVVTCLEDVLATVERVADLIAAEHDVAGHRDRD
jgi:hypothetical protein